ncbi:MAG: hypothetical protein FWF50_01280 [Defluviitaleaceae bacterium]|nr:hypothetical protein [Defluviitaleaceae bacterium]
MADKIDEKIIDLINHNQKLDRDIMNDGAYIHNQIINFKDLELFNGKIVTKIPSYFEYISEEIAKLKYPAEGRPEHILSNKDSSVTFGYSIINEPIKKTEVEDAMKQIKGVIKATNPASDFYSDGLLNSEEENTLNIAWFDYNTFGIDEQIYNITFIAEFESKIFFGTFNCPMREINEWKKPSLECIKNTKIIKN